MADLESELSGVQRAAIFLLGVGEEGAAAIMRYMEPKEVQSVGAAMASLSNISNEQISSVVQEFTEKINEINPIGVGASDFTRRVMVQALGENKARSMLSRVMQGSRSKGMDALKWMDARSVAGVIKNEHPQIMAIVLVSLDGDQAAQVIALLPEQVRVDVMLRIARLDLVDPSALQELDQVLEKQLGKSQKFPYTSVDGMTTAAAIMNNMDAKAEAELMESMKEVDDELAEKINDLMFVFDDLLKVDNRGMQRLIREISVESLVIALKGVGEKVQSKFFDNMSSRAADMLREDLEVKGPIKLREVEEAQKEILNIAAKLAADGDISLGSSGGDYV